MYVHRRCKPSGAELDREKKAGGFCASCGQEGTVYHVKGTDDYYLHILNGVLYDVVNGASSTPMTPVWEAARLQTAKVKAARKGENWTTSPIEVLPQTELAEEIEAIQEVAEEALEEILDEIVEEEEEPEETELEAENKRLKKELAETVEARTLIEDIPEGFLEDEKDTEIARLEAELAELKK